MLTVEIWGLQNVVSIDRTTLATTREEVGTATSIPKVEQNDNFFDAENRFQLKEENIDSPQLYAIRKWVDDRQNGDGYEPAQCRQLTIPRKKWCLLGRDEPPSGTTAMIIWTRDGYIPIKYSHKNNGPQKGTTAGASLSPERIEAGKTPLKKDSVSGRRNFLQIRPKVKYKDQKQRYAEMKEELPSDPIRLKKEPERIPRQETHRKCSRQDKQNMKEDPFCWRLEQSTTTSVFLWESPPRSIALRCVCNWDRKVPLQWFPSPRMIGKQSL